MRFLFFLSTLSFIFLLFPQSLIAEQKKLIIIGDSLTEGYGVAKDSSFGVLLQEKIKKAGINDWEVVVSGISGSTSASAPSRVKWALKSKPNMVILALGANDALRGIKAQETKKNIQEALKILKENKIKIFLAGMVPPPNYGEAYVTEFFLIFPSLAKSNSVQLIPFLLDKVAGNKELNLADGIHPNEKGHEIVAENIFKAIRGSL